MNGKNGYNGCGHGHKPAYEGLAKKVRRRLPNLIWQASPPIEGAKSETLWQVL